MMFNYIDEVLNCTERILNQAELSHLKLCGRSYVALRLGNDRELL